MEEPTVQSAYRLGCARAPGATREIDPSPGQGDVYRRPEGSQEQSPGVKRRDSGAPRPAPPP